MTYLLTVEVESDIEYTEGEKTEVLKELAGGFGGTVRILSWEVKKEEIPITTEKLPTATEIYLHAHMKGLE